MHIAYLTPEYPHAECTSSGGLGTSILNMATALVEKGQKVSVVVYGQKEDKIFQERGIDFYLIRQQTYKIGGWYFYRKYLQRVLNDLVRNKGVDIIEAAEWTGITAFMRLEAPLVLRLHGSDAYFCELEGRKQKWKNFLLEKVALKRADALVSVSSYTAKLTQDIFHLRKEIDIVHNGISVENFQPGIEKQNTNEILYFGTIIRKKGVLELAKAFNRVVTENPKSQLTVIGKDTTDIFENISTLELFKGLLSPEAMQQFRYLKQVEYSEIKNHIQQADIVVLPSFAEALPMTWLEAMSMEKALVTSNIGWAKEIMENGVTGFTVNPNDHIQFSEKVICLLNNPEKRELMGKAARKKVEQNFAMQIVAEKNIRFYKSQLRD
ncbi:glycosyltransferase family 4 protein [Salegentibacter chungangensis]|uniref:Glycosyltransferase family 4 protein n=1 Tax=Salegentibacter chungangensis TaxID=1335724 RepID=A0ABW3NQC0_9FLAO